MSGCPSAEQLVALLNNELAGAHRAAVAGHVTECTVCRQTLEALQQTRSETAAATAVARPHVSADETADYVAALERRSPRAGQKAAEPQIKLELPGFELLGELGRGGMGVVYKARQKSLDRVVALKMIRSAVLAGAAQIARFNTEAAALAQVQHPHIVQVFEIGWHEDMPFLVMEFVPGQTLRDALDAERFSPKRTAQVMEKLARAMFSAHQRGILHRDLKPSNVLLDADGEPKITDFGLAKRVTSDSQLTASDAVMGTPGYMPPEQAQGWMAQVGPQSDVYSLGAILYEILTNRPPFRATTPLETLQQVIHREPLPPRSVHPGIPRDLETICVKCLQKTPAQRYATAADLADDLRRFVQGEPILARPTGWAERGWRWCLRNRGLASALTLTCLAVVGGTAGMVWQSQQTAHQRQRAQQQFARFSAESREKLQLIQDLMERIPDDQRAQDQRLQSALASYEIWLAEEPADPAAQEAYGSALFRVAEIRRRIGQYELAEPIFLKARDQYQRLVDDAPAIVPRRHGLAETWNFLGENYRESGRLLEAIRAYDAAMQHQEILSGQVPREPHYQADIGRSLYNRGLARRDLNELPAAEQDFRRSIQLLQQCLTGHARLDRPRQDLARSQNNLGILLRATQRPQEAQQQYQAAIETLRSLQREFPASADYPFELATVLMNQANLLLADQRSRQLEIAQPLDEAEKTYQASVEIFRELSRQYANVPRYRKGLANSLNGLGAVLSQLTRNEDAEDVWLQASQELKQLVDGSPNVAEYHGLLAQTTHNLAYLHRNDDDPAVVEELLREAVDRQGRAHALSPNNALYADGLRTYQKNLARVLVEAGKHHQAADIAEQLAAGDSGDSRALYDAAKILAACLSRLERAPDTADPAAADPAAADPAAADHYRRRIQTHLARCRAHGLAIQASDFPGLALP